MELCDKRQKFFATIPSGSSVTRATLLFALLTLVTFAAQITALKIMGVEMGLDYYVTIMAASLVVGGIGAGLTSWTRGTNWFQNVSVGQSEKILRPPRKQPDEPAQPNVAARSKFVFREAIHRWARSSPPASFSNCTGLLIKSCIPASAQASRSSWRTLAVSAIT